MNFELDLIRAQWGGKTPLWVFAYASLIWRPEFDIEEQTLAKVNGWHRTLQMWSRVNRGTTTHPSLVLVQKVPAPAAELVLERLWSREMVTGVYEPRWLNCQTQLGYVKALAFTLPKTSPQYTGRLSKAQYQHIFKDPVGGRFGTTLEYAQKTYECLLGLGIHDQALADLLEQFAT